jgi:hypothetical protein
MPAPAARIKRSERASARSAGDPGVAAPASARGRKAATARATTTATYTTAPTPNRTHASAAMRSAPCPLGASVEAAPAHPPTRAARIAVRPASAAPVRSIPCVSMQSVCPWAFTPVQPARGSGRPRDRAGPRADPRGALDDDLLRLKSLLLEDRVTQAHGQAVTLEEPP